MKYLYSILMMLCSFCIFTACSDDENEKGPVQVPVTDIKIPTTIKPGEALTISGKGFTEESRIILQSVKPLLMERTAVNASGLTIRIPEDFETGVYFIILQQAVNVWEIGRTNVITNLTSPVSEVVVPTEATAGDQITVEGKGFAPDCKLSIVGPTNEYELAITQRTDNSLTLHLPAMLKTTDYTLLLRQGEQWELGSIRINAKTGPARLSKIVHIREESDGMKSSDTTTFMYTEGKLDALILGTEYSSQKYTFTYEEDRITVVKYYFNIPWSDPDDPDSGKQEGSWEWSDSYSFILTDNKVSSYETQEKLYEWNYNQDDYLTSLSSGENSSIAYNYEGRNLVSIAKNEWDTKTDYTFSYSEPIQNDKPGIDMTAPLLYLLNGNTAEYQAHLLNICGSVSAELPSEIKVKDKYQETILKFSYRTINGYISKIIKTSENSGKDTYEISYE